MVLLALLSCVKKPVVNQPPKLANAVKIGAGLLDVPPVDPKKHSRPTLDRVEVRHGRLLVVGNATAKGRWIRSLGVPDQLEVLEGGLSFSYAPQMALLPNDAHVYIEGDHAVARSSNGSERFRTPLPGPPFGGRMASLSASLDGSRILVVNAGAVQLLDGEGKILWERSTGSNGVLPVLRPDGGQIFLLQPANGGLHALNLTELAVGDGSVLASAVLWDHSNKDRPFWIGGALYLANRNGLLRRPNLDVPTAFEFCVGVGEELVSVFESGGMLYLAALSGAVFATERCTYQEHLVGVVPTDGRATLLGLFPEGDGFIAVLREGEVFRLDRDFRVQPPFPIAGIPLSAALSPRGDRLVVSTVQSELRLYDLEVGTMRLLKQTSCAIDALEFSPDGRRLHQATCERVGAVGQEVEHPKSRWFGLKSDEGAEVDGAAGVWTEDGVLWAPVGTQLQAVGEDLAPLELGCELVAAAADEGALLGLCEDGRVMDALGNELVMVQPPEDGIRRLVDLPGKKRFAVLQDGLLVDCRKGKCTETPIPGRYVAPAVAVTSAGVLVLHHASEQAPFFLKNLDTGRLAPLPDRVPIDLAASADGQHLAVVFESMVQVLDVTDLRFARPSL